MPAQPSTIASAPSSSRSRSATRPMRSATISSLRKLGDPEADGALARHACTQAERGDIAPVARDRALEDRDDAEALAPCERRQDAALRDAEDRCVGRLPRGMEAGVGEAGNDEGIRAFPLDRAAKRRNHLVHVTLGLDAGRAIGECHAVDGGPAVQAKAVQGARDVLGHCLAAVGVDDEDAGAHGAFPRGGTRPVVSTIRP